MEQVVDHPGVGAPGLYLQVHGGVHVHGHRLNVFTVRPQPLEAGPNRLPGSTFAHPQHLPGLGVDDHAGITVALEQGELVHDQVTDQTEVRLGQVPGQPGLVDALEGVPVQPGQAGDLLERQQGQQCLHVLAQPVGQPGSRGQPGQRLTTDTAAGAAHPPHRHLQPDPVLEQIPVSDSPPRRVMDQGAGSPAAWTARRHLRVGDQVNQALGIGERNEPGRYKAFPARAGERSIAHGGSVLVWLLGRTNNLTRFTVRPYL
eukprot:TRINITY_DN8022_c2_g1_i1.p2 TRINITY_DN8022_c2_g1~~TRINITY_DN8022_c2_g1_i1.p2  ORF type:complete len:259 (+),score=-26.63 TRINITY_DN8022_c2_g1_i1:293-1069(+)